MKDEAARQGHPANTIIDASESSRGSGWLCRCGNEKPKPAAAATPVYTVVSWFEPRCPWCKSSWRDRIGEAS